MIANWAEDIHTISYLDKYKKETMWIDVKNKRSIKLDGIFDATVDLYDTALRADWMTTTIENKPKDVDFDSFDLQLKVPSAWNTQKKELLYYESSIIYRKKFSLSIDKNLDYYLHFEGSNYRTVVFLNSVCVGYHEGGFTPFSIDVSDTILEDNELIISVNAERTNQAVPGKNYDWNNYGGIYRSILLLELRRPYSISHTITFDGEFVDIKAEYKTDKDFELELNSSLFHQKVKTTDGKLHFKKRVNPILWSDKNPELYHIEIGPDIKEDYGFRTIKIEKDKILLNGKELKLKGVSMHEEYGKNARTPSLTDIKKAFQLAKGMNANFIRLTHYPHSKECAELADKMGLLLWEEIPVFWAIEFDNKNTYQCAEAQLTSLIKRDINRASVIIWSIGNENADTKERLNYMSSLAKKAHSLDATRAVTAACLVNHEKMSIEDSLIPYLDIVSFNEYFYWYDNDITKLEKVIANTNISKPIIISEFGAGALLHQEGEEKFSEHYQAEFFKKQFEIINRYDKIKGTIIWQLFDSATPRRINKFQKGFNRKGLIDSDHKSKKLSYKIIKEIYGEKNE